MNWIIGAVKMRSMDPRASSVSNSTQVPTFTAGAGARARPAVAFRISKYEQDMVFWRTLSTDIVPRLKEFEALDVYGERSEELRLVFNHCPPKIQKLKFSLSHSFYSADSDEQHEGEEDARDGDVEIEDPLVELKDLDVSALGPDRDWSAWSAFLRRSVCLESLTVGSIDRWWSQALAKCVRLRRLHIQGCSMKTLGVLASILKNGGLSNLDDIVLRFSRFMSSQVNDQGLADMLSACRKGWRSVDVSVLYPRSADVLIKNHHRTLECLYAEETSSLTSARLYQFLLLCPNLHTFSILEDGAKALPATPARFEADEFIDLDQVTNTLRPWPCESTLRVFRAKIARIPRPDVTHTYHGFPRDEDNYQYDEFDEEVRLEEYPGQGRDIQHRVYERLSRFKQLEVLALGHNDRDTLSFSRESNYHPDAQGVDVYFDEMFQYECLSMNLQRSGGGSSGMELLAELKDLRELNVHRMATCIGVEEVRWMTQNWPKLRSLTDLVSYPRHNGEQQAVEMEGQEGLLPSIRALNVICQDGNQCPPSLSWFLSRCTNLESLHVSRLDETWVRALEACIRLKCLRIGSIDEESPKLLTMTLKNGLSSLDSIQIDSCNEGFQDQDIADMLAACHRGWRSISIPRLGAIAVRAVIRHCATLESLTLRRSYGLTSGDILQILSSSPRLESLVTLISDNVRHPCTELTHIMATDFIDAEPFSESLKSWACEPTLKVFRARISGIPRPDITETFTGYPMQDDLILSEDYPGQSHEIQQRVYRRFARLAKLERLELGYEDRDLSDSSRDLGYKSQKRVKDARRVEGVEGIECHADDN
ncbi:hypothetical protein BGZ97_011465 [Linnemannia gamsii]|uniref:RNI-like protein n=1 Tax=Linnemannia gamsii TaxID=64522 RepID=A0A9P6R6G7_9FUNG|nr:hypothetical protein BGZ97_011465 [Linnemannia gamsii]